MSYNESTFGDGTRDYTSLATWEAATDNNLVTAAQGEVLTCYDDSAPYTDSVIIAGATTNSSYFRVIRAASSHRGTETSGVRFAKTGDGVVIINTSENYVGVYNVAVTGSGNGTFKGIAASGTYAKIVGCTAYNMSCPGGFPGAAMGIAITGNNSYIINCVATNVQDAWSYYGAITVSSGSGSNSYYVYNCTAYDNGMDFYVDGNGGTATLYLKNCIYNNTQVYMSATMNTMTCIDYSSTTPTFEADGYHLAASDTAAKDQGTDLSGDGAFPFDDDIDGDTRSGDWDIGCDEYYVAPSAPSNVSATDGDHTDKVTVSWDAVDGATGYEIWRHTSDVSGSATRIEDAYGGGESYDDATAVAGTLYYYWVKTESAGGTSDFSSSDSGYRAVSAPTGVSATDGTYTDKVTVSWNAATGATSYEIWRHTSDDSGSATRIEDAYGGGVSYDDESVVVDTTYYYWIKSEDSSPAHTSDFSSSDSGYAEAASPPPPSSNGPPLTIRSVEKFNIRSGVRVNIRS